LSGLRENQGEAGRGDIGPPASHDASPTPGG
jgi:hypothetical protein